MDLKDDQHKLSFFHHKKLWFEVVDIAAKPTIGRMAFGLVWWLDIVKWRDPRRKSSGGSSHCEHGVVAIHEVWT